MRVFLRTILFIILSALLGCNGDPIAVFDPQAPEITAFIVPETATLDPAESILVHVRSRDPQGVADLGQATLLADLPGGMSSAIDMRDDGMDGDIIAHDGQYVARLPGTFWGAAGEANLTARVEDKAGNAATSDAHPIMILTAKKGQPPVLRNITFPDTVFVDAAAELQLLVQVSDADGLPDVDSVGYAVFPPAYPVPALQGRLADDGVTDDGIAANGLFGARLQSQDLAGSRGLFTLRLQAFDKSGNASLARTRTFLVDSRLENLPPAIDSVAAPDTISRSTTGPFVIRAQVSDPNGLADVTRVFFNTFLPNGQASSGNPFFMRDDGVVDGSGLGDNQADDGEYALAITITVANATGTYRFEFQAEDRKGLLSEKRIHTIVVVE